MPVSEATIGEKRESTGSAIVIDGKSLKPAQIDIVQATRNIVDCLWEEEKAGACHLVFQR